MRKLAQARSVARASINDARPARFSARRAVSALVAAALSLSPAGAAAAALTVGAATAASVAAAPSAQAAPLPTLSCSSFYAMTQTSSGDADATRRVYSVNLGTGAMTDIGGFKPSPTGGALRAINGLAIDKTNNVFWAAEASTAATQPHVYRLNADGTTTAYLGSSWPSGVTPDIVVAGAFDPVSKIYYYGATTGVANEKKDVWIFGFNTVTGQPLDGLVGRIPLPDDVFLSSRGVNGDFAFDSKGNLYTTLDGTVNTIAGKLPTVGAGAGASAAAIPVIENVPLSGVPGVATQSMAFDSTGHMVVGATPTGNPSTAYFLDPATGAQDPAYPSKTLTVNGANGAVQDYASCANPNSVTVVKDLPEGRYTAGSTEQFQLDLSGGGLVAGNPGVTRGLTAGSESGKQTQDNEEFIGPTLTLTGQSLTVTEAALPAPGKQYKQSLQCIDEANGNAPVTLTGNTGGKGTFVMPSATGNGHAILCTFTNTKFTPVAVDDAKTGPANKPVVVSPLVNDTQPNGQPALDGTVQLLNASGTAVTSLTVKDPSDPSKDAGTYTVGTGTDGKPTLIFTPAAGFSGTAPAATYRVTDTNGTTATATFTPSVTPGPTAQADTSSGTQGAKQSVDPLANDAKGPGGSDLDPSTLTLLDANGDPATSVTVPNQGTYTIDAAGKIVFTPLPSFTGKATPVDYRVADLDGNPATSTYTPTVTPVAVPDTSTGLQGAPQTKDVLANDTPAAGVTLDASSLKVLDASGQPVSGPVPALDAQGNTVGSYAVGSGGTIVFTPNKDFVGTAVPVKYQVTDSNGNVVQSTYEPTVTAVKPVAVNDTSTGPQGVAQKGEVLKNDAAGDASVPLDPGTLKLKQADGSYATTPVTVPGQGTYSIVNGDVVFTPLPSFSGTATPVTYQVADKNETTTTATYTPTVTAVVPKAANDTSTGTQGAQQKGDVLKNDAAGDASVPLDPGTLKLKQADGSYATTPVTVPGQGTYSIVNGDVVFTPLPSFSGTTTPVTYQVADKNGTTTTATYTPTVTPVAAPDTSSDIQGAVQTQDVLANDTVDPNVTLDPSTLVILDTSGNPVSGPVDAFDAADPSKKIGTFEVKDGKVVFTPNKDFVGTAVPVKYEAKDQNGNSVGSTYEPTVTAVKPTAAPDTTKGPQGVAQTSTVLDNDTAGDDRVPVDGSTLTLLDKDGTPVTEVKVPGQGTYTLSTLDGKPAITFTPEPTFTGKATPVTYQVKDANGTPTTSSYTPEFDPVAPSSTPDKSTGTQGSPQTVTPLGNDTPGVPAVPLDPTTFTLLDENGDPTTDPVVYPGVGTYTTSTDPDGKPVITFTPEPGFTGTPPAVSYRVEDKNGTPTTSTYAPTVTPVAAPDTSSDIQGAVQTQDVLANDTLDPNVTLDPSTLVILDADGTPAAGPVDAFDAANPTTKIGTFEVKDGKVVFTPNKDFVGTAVPVKYEAKDQNGNAVGSTYTPTVTAVKPTAAPDTTKGPQGVAQTSTVLDNDTAGDDRVALDPTTLTLLDKDGKPVSELKIPGEGTYTLSTLDGKPAITFTPEPTFTGKATPVTYQVKDANGTPTTSSYTPEFDKVTPAAQPDITSGPQGTPQTVKPLANDAPGVPAVPLDPTTFTLLDENGDPATSVDVPGKGTYTTSTDSDGKPVITFTPDPSFSGTPPAVSYRVEDKNGTPTTSTYQPTVTEVVPVANPDKTTGTQGAKQSIDPLINDDPDNGVIALDPSTLTLLGTDGQPTTDPVVVPGQGTYTLENGKIVFTPLPEFTGEATPVSYRVENANGTPAISKYTPTVTPVAAPDASSDIQGAVQTQDVLANDTVDPNVTLDPSTLVILDADGKPAAGPVDAFDAADPSKKIGTFEVKDGKVVFTPNKDFVGTAVPVKYQAQDAKGNAVQSTYTPTVTAVTPAAAADTTKDAQGLPQKSTVLDNDVPGDDRVALDPTTLTLLDKDGTPVTEVKVPGQGTYTLSTLDGKPAIMFTPEPAFTGEATPVTYQVKDANGTPTTSSYTPTVTPVTPVANPDKTSNIQGLPQEADVLGNDQPGDDRIPLVPSTLTLLDPDNKPVTELSVEGVGSYEVVTENGKTFIRFTPEPQYAGTPPAVSYQVEDQNGTVATSTYQPTVDPVVPTAEPNTSKGPQGIAQTSDVLADDKPGDDRIPLVPGTLTLLDADGNAVKTLKVDGEGVYELVTVDGKPVIRFTPEKTFVGTATAVSYRVADSNGTTVVSTYTPSFTEVKPEAVQDSSKGTQGAQQSVDPLANDQAGDPAVPLDPTTLTLLDQDGKPTADPVDAVDPATGKKQGTYSIEEGRIVFTPLPEFIGTATPVSYQVADENGTTTTSTYAPEVTPVAQPDTTSGPQGVPQTSDVLANDTAEGVTLDPGTLTLLDAEGKPTDAVTVKGQGTYTVKGEKLVFTPEPQFVGTATPVSYQVKDSKGNTVQSTYTPSFDQVTPVATPDTSKGPQGVPQSIDPLKNDEAGDPSVPLDPTSLTLLDQDGKPTKDPVVVADPETGKKQGTYTIEDGKIVFTPEKDFVGTPVSITYRVEDVNGTPTTSTYTPSFEKVTPVANPDDSVGLQGDPQSIDPLKNDKAGDKDVPLDPTTLTLLDQDGKPTKDPVVVVDPKTGKKQGTYTIEDGKIVFTPEKDFVGVAVPVSYRVLDANGTPTESTYAPTVMPGETGFELTKLTNGQDVAQAPGPNLKVGDKVTWSYEVKNIGNVDLKDVAVVDRDANGTVVFEDVIASLPAGKSVTLKTTGVVTADQYKNTANATAKDPTGKKGTLSEGDSSWYFGVASSLHFDKTVGMSQNGAFGENVSVASGGSVFWKFTVRNDGNAEVKDIVVKDPQLGRDVQIGTLAPGETRSVTVEQAKLMAGYTNQATAEGQDPIGGTPSSGDEASVKVDKPFLPDTGARVTAAVAAGTLLLLVGSGIVLVVRRRSRQA